MTRDIVKTTTHGVAQSHYAHVSQRIIIATYISAQILEMYMEGCMVEIPILNEVTGAYLILNCHEFRHA